MRSFVNYKLEKIDQAIKNLETLKERGTNFSEILIDTIEAFKINMKHNFDARQSPDAIPVRWKKLTKKYGDWKYRFQHGLIGKTFGKRVNAKGEKVYYKAVANLILNGKLKAAVYGGPGWMQSVTKNKATFGIVGIPYASAHEYGVAKTKLPARPYFLAKGNKFPPSVLNFLVSRIEQAVEGAI